MLLQPRASIRAVVSFFFLLLFFVCKALTHGQAVVVVPRVRVHHYSDHVHILCVCVMENYFGRMFSEDGGQPVYVSHCTSVLFLLFFVVFYLIFSTSIELHRNGYVLVFSGVNARYSAVQLAEACVFALGQ